MSWHRINGYTRDTRNAACSMCGTSQRTLNRTQPEAVYTTGIEIFMEGTIDICHSCLIEGAVLAGCLTDVQTEQLQNDLAEAHAEIEALRSSLKDQGEVEEALHKLSAHLNPAGARPKVAPQPPPFQKNKAKAASGA